TFSVKNLSVNRSDKPVFRNLNFEIGAGELLKLVGPNGSGKSTLLKTIAGLIENEQGDIEWLSQNICYLGHKNALKREFTVLENIEFWAELWGTQSKVNSSIDQMGIRYLADTQVRYLSSGQTRRTALARSLCHDASIWLFDEPTVGLDDHGLALLSGAMKSHLNAGGIIICATHVDLGIDQNGVKTLNLGDYSVAANYFEGQW
ncbi:UNVERIFIED_CONTAM: hypothetical protein GTU68_000726, partial [Idotea baltica]|nr:hypothetical protein [Idotea baltica]